MLISSFNLLWYKVSVSLLLNTLTLEHIVYLPPDSYLIATVYWNSIIFLNHISHYYSLIWSVFIKITYMLDTFYAFIPSCILDFPSELSFLILLKKILY